MAAPLVLIVDPNAPAPGVGPRRRRGRASRRGRPGSARRRTARALAWAPLGLALACASGGAPLPGTRPGPAPAAPAASAAPAVSGLVLTVEPADAELVVNGAPRGNVSALPDGLLPLAPGRYRLSLRRQGYATWRAEVSVQRGIDPLRVELAPADTGGSP